MPGGDSSSKLGKMNGSSIEAARTFCQKSPVKHLLNIYIYIIYFMLYAYIHSCLLELGYATSASKRVTSADLRHAKLRWWKTRRLIPRALDPRHDCLKSICPRNKKTDRERERKKIIDRHEYKNQIRLPNEIGWMLTFVHSKWMPPCVWSSHAPGRP